MFCEVLYLGHMLRGQSSALCMTVHGAQGILLQLRVLNGRRRNTEITRSSSGEDLGLEVGLSYVPCSGPHLMLMEEELEGSVLPTPSLVASHYISICWGCFMVVVLVALSNRCPSRPMGLITVLLRMCLPSAFCF